MPGIFGMDIRLQRENERLKRELQEKDKQLAEKDEDIREWKKYGQTLGAYGQTINTELKCLREQVQCLAQGQERIEQNMAVSREELDQALSGLGGQVNQVGVDVVAAIDRLTAKVNSGQDFTAEADAIRGFGEALQQVDVAAVAAGQDTLPTPEPAPGSRKK